MPHYAGTLRARLKAEYEADKRKAEVAATEANAARDVAELEADGWIERG